MPTYIPEPKLPDWANPETSSVFDPLYETLVKRAVGVLGIDKPETAIESLMNPMGVPAGLIAKVPPAEIAALRQRGKELLERVLAEGLEERSLGKRPFKSFEDISKVKDWSNIPKEFYKDNIPVPEELGKALTFAQQKYPRIFGHIAELTDVDAWHQLKDGSRILGAQIPDTKFDSSIVSEKLLDKFVPTGFGKLQFSPSVMAKGSHDPAQTVGHELLHLADTIVNPVGATKGYQASMELPGGYKASAYEARANVQGDRFANKMRGIPNPKPRSLNSIEDEILSNPPPKPGIIQTILDLFNPSK